MTVVIWPGKGPSKPASGPAPLEAHPWHIVGLQVRLAGAPFMPLGSRHALPMSPWLAQYLVAQPGANDKS